MRLRVSRITCSDVPRCPRTQQAHGMVPLRSTPTVPASSLNLFIDRITYGPEFHSAKCLSWTGALPLFAHFCAKSFRASEVAPGQKVTMIALLFSCLYNSSGV